MDLTYGTLLVALLATIAVAKSFTKKSAQEHLPLPPGPKPLPILGNLHQINRAFPWITYKEWSEIYGDIIYSRILNQNVIILNSEKVARALLEQRSSNYSDRPRFVMPSARFGVSFRTPMQGYGDAWRRHRRIFHQAFRPDAAVIYQPMQLRKAHQLLLDLLHDPGNYELHLETHSASIIMSAVYDYETKPNDPLVSMIRGAMDSIIKAETPEKAAIIDAYPTLTLLPAWFPGASFKRHALELKSVLTDMVEIPFEYALDKFSSGLSATSMVSEGLARFQGDASFELAIKESSATAFGGVPHAAVNDDVYDGYLIPKGTTILTNIWYGHNSHTQLLASHRHDPERFFTPSGDLNDDLVTPVWGWGRRICAGRYLADASVWSAIVSMLTVFDFLKAKDASGKDIDFEPRWTSGVASRPVNFPCRIIPRRGDMDVEKLTSLISIAT
ncbi:hypothetical protein AZE42_09771 [Rhizopogon vesiculosus]|uniref:Cytochrome P450 n=1 Tax=Rhizopogon vesiculosus TaxID=180088 RepID=A0A1J8QBA3_9AGAM|nr:hypothetical protein AZE42_09771 [Rhizopogon vesiculosus]